MTTSITWWPSWKVNRESRATLSGSGSGSGSGQGSGSLAHLVEEHGARGEALHGVHAVPEGEVALEGEAVEEQMEGRDRHLIGGGGWAASIAWGLQLRSREVAGHVRRAVRTVV
eukprot:scaffold24646_cov48-Phaeocystis_antarctica.AAC.1